MATAIQKYVSNGVTVSKSTIYVGDKITLTYDGFLVGSGADNIIAHVGYNELWEDRTFIQMDNVDGIFSASFIVNRQGTLNVAFKDGTDNWDNNSFENYSFKVSVKKASSSKSETKTTTSKVVKPVSEKSKKATSKVSASS